MREAPVLMETLYIAHTWHGLNSCSLVYWLFLMLGTARNLNPLIHVPFKSDMGRRDLTNEKIKAQKDWDSCPGFHQ